MRSRLRPETSGTKPSKLPSASSRIARPGWCEVSFSSRSSATSESSTAGKWNRTSPGRSISVSEPFETRDTRSSTSRPRAASGPSAKLWMCTSFAPAARAAAIAARPGFGSGGGSVG